MTSWFLLKKKLLVWNDNEINKNYQFIRSANIIMKTLKFLWHRYSGSLEQSSLNKSIAQISVRRGKIELNSLNFESYLVGWFELYISWFVKFKIVKQNLVQIYLFKNKIYVELFLRLLWAGTSEWCGTDVQCIFCCPEERFGWRIGGRLAS